MKKYIFLLILVFVPIKVNAVSLDGATSVILMDMDTNRVLIEKNIHTIRSVASISNIMTISRLNQKIKDYVISFFKPN